MTKLIPKHSAHIIQSVNDRYSLRESISQAIHRNSNSVHHIFLPSKHRHIAYENSPNRLNIVIRCIINRIGAIEFNSKASKNSVINCEGMMHCMSVDVSRFCLTKCETCFWRNSSGKRNQDCFKQRTISCT